MQVNVFEARNRLSKLIKRAQAGEEIIIANRGEPVARLIPTGKSVASTDDRAKGRAIIDWLIANPVPDHARRSGEEIDAAIEEERRAWD